MTPTDLGNWSIGMVNSNPTPGMQVRFCASVMSCADRGLAAYKERYQMSKQDPLFQSLILNSNRLKGLIFKSLKEAKSIKIYHEYHEDLLHFLIMSAFLFKNRTVPYCIRNNLGYKYVGLLVCVLFKRLF
jgi:hypothetical protein